MELEPEQFRAAGYDAVIIGADGSPSCGVRTTAGEAGWGGRPSPVDDTPPTTRAPGSWPSSWPWPRRPTEQCGNPRCGASLPGGVPIRCPSSCWMPPGARRPSSRPSSPGS